MKKTIYILYCGDEWLTNKSLTCMGVFSVRNTAIFAVRKEIMENLEFDYNDEKTDYENENGEFDIDIYREIKADEICDELMKRNQTQGHYENWIIREAYLDEFGEI